MDKECVRQTKKGRKEREEIEKGKESERKRRDRRETESVCVCDRLRKGEKIDRMEQ